MSTNAVSEDPSSPLAAGGVRRHHTISSSSRAARAAAKETISEYDEAQQDWNEDEVVGEGWVGGVGAVGEKSSLHRQASLPTRYNRAFQAKGPKSGTMTPSKLNSLSAIAGHDGDEEDWELQRAIGAYNAHDDEKLAQSGASQEDLQDVTTPLSPTAYGNPSQVPSPPPAASGVRRHQSMTYGAARNKQNLASGLKRSGTLQTPLPHGAAAPQTPTASANEEPEEEYGYAAEEPGIYDEEYKPYGPMSPIGRSSPWGNNGSEWRTPGGSISSTGSGAIDDVQRALSALEISNNSYAHGGNAFQATGQSVHPPRFNPAHPPPQQQPGMRNVMPGMPNNGKMPLNNEFNGRKTPTGSGSFGGGQGNWEQQPRERSVTPRRSNPNMQYNKGNNVPSVPPIPAQYLQQSQGPQPRVGLNSSVSGPTSPVLGNTGQAPIQGFVNTPIDVPSLIAAKGYNPSNFDIRPQFARYFVIKSYTEDDVHKSLKYEIWSSTDPGNKRLDKAFKETAGRGPIYLFFSVNASGHFCGMAEMLTPVDYSRSSTVWASDKWKGVFKVRWIFVRDIPNVSLRHIKLNNTQERKPVTNSRDTQELLSDAGLEMLRIFSSHPARTSLLQDFAFYELQSMQKMQQGTNTPGQGSNAVSPIATPAQLASPQLGSTSPNLSQQQQSPNLFMQSPYQVPAMNPMLQMQMQMQMNNLGMGMGGMGLGSQFGMPQNQAMQQSVMRNPSPGPQGGGNQGFMGMPTF